MEGWAVTDPSGRYAVKDTRDEAMREARFLANRHQRAFIVHYWNGPKWREDGHWVEYRESPCTQVYPERGAPPENAVRVALLVQQLRDEGRSEVEAVREVARALGITNAAVAAAVLVVVQA